MQVTIFIAEKSLHKPVSVKITIFSSFGKNHFTCCVHDCHQYHYKTTQTLVGHQDVGSWVVF